MGAPAGKEASKPVLVLTAAWPAQKASHLRAAGTQAWLTPPWFWTVSATIQPSGTPCRDRASTPHTAACSWAAPRGTPLERRLAATGCSVGSMLLGGVVSGRRSDLRAQIAHALCSSCAIIWFSVHHAVRVSIGRRCLGQEVGPAYTVS